MGYTGGLILFEMHACVTRRLVKRGMLVYRRFTQGGDRQCRQKLLPRETIRRDANTTDSNQRGFDRKFKPLIIPRVYHDRVFAYVMILRLIILWWILFISNLFVF